jgi:hypothetical protein
MTSDRTSKSPRMRAARSRMLGLVYCALGPDRNIDTVVRIAAENGMKLTRTTVARYSATDGWVERARRFDEERSASRERTIIETALAADSDHSDFFARARQIAYGQLGKVLAQAEAVDGEPIDLSPLEATRMGEIAFKAERLIAGQSTDRVHILTSDLRVLVGEMGPAVATMADEIERAADTLPEPQRTMMLNALHVAKVQFARRFDSLIEAQYTAHGLSLESGEAIDA